MSGKIDPVSCQMHYTNNLTSESCKFTPEWIYPNVNMHRDSTEFCPYWVLQESELTLKVAKIPEKITSLKLVFLTNLGVLQTFSTNQTAGNKQVIQGLLESCLPCTLNIVLLVKRCAFLEWSENSRQYPVFSNNGTSGKLFSKIFFFFTFICVTYVQKDFYNWILMKPLSTKCEVFTKLPLSLAADSMI